MKRSNLLDFLHSRMSLKHRGKDTITCEIHCSANYSHYSAKLHSLNSQEIPHDAPRATHLKCQQLFCRKNNNFQWFNSRRRPIFQICIWIKNIAWALIEDPSRNKIIKLFKGIKQCDIFHKKGKVTMAAIVWMHRPLTSSDFNFVQMNFTIYQLTGKSPSDVLTSELCESFPLRDPTNRSLDSHLTNSPEIFETMKLPTHWHQWSNWRGL